MNVYPLGFLVVLPTSSQFDEKHYKKHLLVKRLSTLRVLYCGIKTFHLLFKYFLNFCIAFAHSVLRCSCFPATDVLNFFPSSP